jgi:hypothetical protein
MADFRFGTLDPTGIIEDLCALGLRAAGRENIAQQRVRFAYTGCKQVLAFSAGGLMRRFPSPWRP